MRNKLLIILALIFGYTFSCVAEEKRSLGESIYSSKLYSKKYHSGVKKEKAPLEKYNGLLYERGTGTLKGGTETPAYTTTEEKFRGHISTKVIPKSLLSGSLYKKPVKKENTSINPPTSEIKEEDELHDYYSNIFYRKDKGEEKEVNPFLRK